VAVGSSPEAPLELPAAVLDGLDDEPCEELSGFVLGVPVASPPVWLADPAGLALRLGASAVDAASSSAGVSAGAVPAAAAEPRAERATAPGDPPPPAPTRSARGGVVLPRPTVAGEVSFGVVPAAAGLTATGLIASGFSGAAGGVAIVVRGGAVAPVNCGPPLAAAVTTRPAAATNPATVAARARRRRGAPDRVVAGATPPTASDPIG
jgi:hypothetical protein